MSYCLFIGFNFTVFLADASPVRASRSYSYDHNQAYGPWQDGKDPGKVSFTLSESVPQTSKTGKSFRQFILFPRKVRERV